MRVRFCALLCVVSLFAVSFAARADTVSLLDGTDYEGTVLRENDESLTFLVRLGGMKGSIIIPKKDILFLKRQALRPDPIATEGQVLQRAAESETDVKKAVGAWMRVAEYYERHPGFSPQVRASYEKVLLFDADHLIARAKLGYQKTVEGWKKPEPKVLIEEPEADTIRVGVRETPRDELAISLRRDAATLKKLLDEQAARIDAPRERERREAQQVSYPVDYGYNGYNGYGTFISDGGYGFCGVPLLSNYSGYGYSGNGCSPYFGSGLSVGFRGSLGPVRFTGSINNGYHGIRSSYGPRRF